MFVALHSHSPVFLLDTAFLADLVIILHQLVDIGLRNPHGLHVAARFGQRGNVLLHPHSGFDSAQTHQR